MRHRKIVGIALLIACVCWMASCTAKTVEEASPSPDFLSEDQKAAYETAQQLYLDYFAFGPTAFIQQDGAADAPTAKIKESDMKQAVGPYAGWDDFMALLQSAFTEDCAQELLRSDEAYPAYAEKDGFVYYTDGGRGANEFWVGPDLFALTSSGEGFLNFQVIGQYDYQDGQGVVQELFPVNLQETQDGWRVTLISITK